MTNDQNLRNNQRSSNSLNGDLSEPPPPYSPPPYEPIQSSPQTSFAIFPDIRSFFSDIPVQYSREGEMVFLQTDSSYHNPDEQNECLAMTIYMFFLYGVVFFSCIFCGFFCGIVVLIFAMVGERGATKFQSNKTYFLKGLFFLILFILTLCAFIFVTLQYKYNHYPFCRYGVTKNKSCCPEASINCSSTLLSRDSNGCFSCCLSNKCINQAKYHIFGCPNCEFYSKEKTKSGCHLCCEEKVCISNKTYSDSKGCFHCCPYFFNHECLLYGQTKDMNTSCTLCCEKCKFKSNKIKSNKCPLCCNDIPKNCSKTYIDQNNCLQCCDIVCSTKQMMFGIETCKKCCSENSNQSFCS